MSDEFDSLLIKLLESEIEKNDDENKELIKQVFSSLLNSKHRIPAPLNITEIGGYYNLLSGDDVMRRQLLASILGLPL